MRRRVGPLTLVLLGLLVPTPAQAHKLEGEFKVLPAEKRVRIETWFDLTGDAPKDAKVKVLRADGTVLTEGKTDSDGKFTFIYEQPEPLRVVVTADDGHRCELRITEKAFGLETTDVRPPPSSGVTLRDIMAGIALLLAAAAFVMSWRNAHQLRMLRGEQST
jgi:hypothetical protein